MISPRGWGPVEWAFFGQVFQKYIIFHGQPMLCTGPKTPTEWKSESVIRRKSIYLWTGVGARDAYA